MTIQDRPVLEQLAEAVKWWNADEAEEPDVRRLFAACKAEIERLQAELADMAEMEIERTKERDRFKAELAALRGTEGEGFGESPK